MPCETFRSSAVGSRRNRQCGPLLGAEEFICPNRLIRSFCEPASAPLSKETLAWPGSAVRSQLEEWNKTLEQRVQEQVTQLDKLSRLKRFSRPSLLS